MRVVADQEWTADGEDVGVDGGLEADLRTDPERIAGRDRDDGFQTLSLEASLTPRASSSLYMYLMQSFMTITLGDPTRFTLMHTRSYHSMMPRSSSPSFRTTTIGVREFICLR
jgi:hypothetical protein